MHLKTKDEEFNAVMRMKLGRLYGRHTATLTKEEAKVAKKQINEALDAVAVKGLVARTAVKDLHAACNLKIEEGSHGK